MADTNPRHSGRGLDRAASISLIALCAVAIVWIVRDLAADSPGPSAAATRAAAASRPTGRPAPAVPAAPISLDGAALKGSPDARAVLIIYSDFECPYCARFANDTWPAIEEKYVTTGKVRVAFRPLPLERIHPAP
jgi:protein-disulfide isomerase